MSSYDPGAAITLPGRLVIGPSQADLLGAYPGTQGTPVGFVAEAELEIEEERLEVFSEVRSSVIGSLLGVTRALFHFVLVQDDPTITGKLYATTATSAGGFQAPAPFTRRLPAPWRNVRPGLQLPDSRPLLFWPDKPSNPALLIYAPVYTHGRPKRIAHRLDRSREELVTVRCAFDANGNDIACDLLEHLSLT